MNHSDMNVRNYRMVETLRQQNLREQRRLDNRLAHRQGMQAAHNYEIASLSYEQRKLRQEMVKIKQSTPASANLWKYKPGRASTDSIRIQQSSQVVSAGHSGQAVAQPHQRWVDHYSGDTHAPNAQFPLLPSADDKCHGSNDTGDKSKKHFRIVTDNNVSHNSEQAMEPDTYNPDGNLRTVLAMPDIKKTMNEAQKARYVRHKEKQWYERELTVGEIFNKDIEQHHVIS